MTKPATPESQKMIQEAAAVGDRLPLPSEEQQRDATASKEKLRLSCRDPLLQGTDTSTQGSVVLVQSSEHCCNALSRVQVVLQCVAQAEKLSSLHHEPGTFVAGSSATNSQTSHKAKRSEQHPQGLLVEDFRQEDVWKSVNVMSRV
ncbi:hypothetical protein FOCC_FOCC012854 [Frankliniella occidentalis]|nr:hypothetical protein FOCC_FOCC012854 [Frankliniella occidentalis]